MTARRAERHIGNHEDSRHEVLIVSLETFICKVKLITFTSNQFLLNKFSHTYK